MKVCYVVFVRDKVKHIPATVRSVLGQECEPLDIYFSDQGSTDGTREAIEKVVQTYNGHHRVKIIDCPDTEPKGMPGLIAHINWLHSALDYDFWITCAGDDIDFKERAKRTLEVIRGLDRLPRFFGTAQHFMNPDLSIQGHTGYPSESRWIEPIECMEHRVGGSCSGAWSQQLMQEFGPLPAHALTDVYSPFMASLMDGFYFLNEILHAYIWRRDPNNTGHEALRNMAKTDAEREQINEVNLFQLANNLMLMTAVTETLNDAPGKGGCKKNLEEILQYLYQQNLQLHQGWTQSRWKLTEMRVPPIGLKA